MVDYLPRSAWNAAPAKPGPGNLTPSRVQGVVIHWPGSGETDSFDSRSEVAAALRGWQRFHQIDRGWSDIAYQVAVDQEGNAWTLRGLLTQSGANGNNDLNERYGAILLVLVAGEEPSAAMKATTREVITDFRRIYGQDADEIHPHSAVRPDGTDCPGPKTRAAIARGDFTPGHVQEDDDMAFTEAQIRAMIQAELEEYNARLWGPKGTAGVFMAQVKAAMNPAAIAQAIVDKLPTGAIDQATVEAGVRAVLKEGTD